MKLLLDTHAYLWWDSDGAKLSEAHHEAIASPQNEVFVSAVTVWEIAIKQASGKLVYGKAAGKAIKKHGFQPLPITVEHAELAGGLAPLHRDPFDRLLVAQAQLEGLLLVTVDEQILRYPVPHL
jgi:PIN domain nuclease of toxin-antitoxin system